MVQAGSIVAVGSSIAARSALGGALLGSAAAPVVLLGGGLAAAVAAIGAAVAGDAARAEADQSRLEGAGPTWSMPFFIAVHDWGIVRVSNHASREAAQAAWDRHGNSPLRRILFELGPVTRPNNVMRPWRELDFGGDERAARVDDGMRDVLHQALETEA
jgi:hypothetical protein